MRPIVIEPSASKTMSETIGCFSAHGTHAFQVSFAVLQVPGLCIRANGRLTSVVHVPPVKGTDITAPIEASSQTTPANTFDPLTATPHGRANDEPHPGLGVPRDVDDADELTGVVMISPVSKFAKMSVVSSSVMARSPMPTLPTCSAAALSCDGENEAPKSRADSSNVPTCAPKSFNSVTPPVASSTV